MEWRPEKVWTCCLQLKNGPDPKSLKSSMKPLFSGGWFPFAGLLGRFRPSRIRAVSQLLRGADGAGAVHLLVLEGQSTHGASLNGKGLVPCPFCSTILLFNNQIRFPRVFGGFLERRAPAKNGEATLRSTVSHSSNCFLHRTAGFGP